MSEFRNLRVCMEDIEALEAAGDELMRCHKTTEALGVLAVALRLRGSWMALEPIEPPSNVIEFPGHSRKVPA